MFPFRYYLSRFFPSRFFPKVGSDQAPIVYPSVRLRYEDRPDPTVAVDERSSRLRYEPRSTTIEFRR